MNKSKKSLQVPLILVLVMPVFYYPLSNYVIFPIIRDSAPRLVDSTRTIVAVTLAVLVLVAFLIDVIISRSQLRALNFRHIFSMPITWAALLVLWLIIVTIPQVQPSSIQNVTAYVVALALLAMTSFETGLVERMWKIWTLLFAVLLAIFGAIGFFNYSAFLFLGSNPRLYATYGVIAICMLFSIRISWLARAALVVAVYASIVVSESRAALVTALVVVVLGCIVIAKKPIVAGVVAVLAGLVSLLVTLNIPIISRRMEIADITTPGLAVNDSGRLVGWRAVIDSIQGAPIWGQGAGSGQTVTLRDAWPIDHPHSEYLRVLHDGGIVGGLLALIFILLLLWTLRPRTKGHPRDPMIIGSFLLVVAALVLGTIENFLVFPSLMWPAAVFIGLGLKRSRENSSVLNSVR